MPTRMLMGLSQAKDVVRQLRRRLVDADATIEDEWGLARTQRQQLNAAAVVALAHSHIRRERAILTALQAAQAQRPRASLPTGTSSSTPPEGIATLPIDDLDDDDDDANRGQ